MTLSAPEPNSHPAAAVPSDSRQDPAMRSLYHMSRTAGVGLQDYAAVNVFAVIGVLLAVASVLVLIFADAIGMLVIPAAAITISIVAFAQIQGSNGTQTGRGIAIAGLLIALGFAGTNLYGRAHVRAQEIEDRAEISKLVQQFETAAAAGKSADAYALFDSRFRDTVQPETFDRTLTSRINQSFAGPKITHVDLGERIQFETDANGIRFATALLTMRTDTKMADGTPLQGDEAAEFRKVDDVWKIHNIMNWFPTTPAKPGGGGAPPQ
jgi:hypothetical protein